MHSITINTNRYGTGKRIERSTDGLLQLLGHIKTEEELDELRQLVCDYYARKIDEEMDQLWAEGKWDNEKNEAVLKEHLRTPYKYAE